MLSFFLSSAAVAKPAKKDFYQIKVYHLKSNEQVAAVDRYLKDAYLPALHKAGINKVGVFKPVGNDTAQLKKIYVLIPFRSIKQWQKLPEQLDMDGSYQSAGNDFIHAPADKKPFERIESILLEAFQMHPRYEMPGLKSFDRRVYELRSYESPTEHLHKIKVKMFNEGGEMDLFKRLGFNAVFYGKVLSGAKMPNLMYITTFENINDRDAHWKAFGSSPEWKTMSALPEYENKVSVSRIDIVLMHPTDYSDI